jgi:hypothetical protein
MNSPAKPNTKVSMKAIRAAIKAIPRAPPHPTLKMDLKTRRTPMNPITRLKVASTGEVIATKMKKTNNPTNVAIIALPNVAEREKILAESHTGIEATIQDIRNAANANSTEITTDTV